MIPKLILLGGAPRSGKSSLARALSRDLGHDVVATDDLGVAKRAGDVPVAAREVDYREHYVRQTPDVLWAEALEGHRRLWPSIAAVVRERLHWGHPAIVEGWALLPEFVSSLEDPGVFAVWLTVPTTVVESRVRAEVDFYAGARDPERMVQNFVARGELYDRHVRREAAASQLPVIDVPDEPLHLTAERLLAVVSSRE